MTKAGDLFEEGLAIRREVLGDEYVDAALARADAFSMPLEHLVTSWCWGSAWSRDGLERKYRSLINLGILVALNRPEELRIHVRAALRNGATIEEIREALLQATVYCGVPAGVEAFRVAQAVLKEAGALK